MKNLITVLTLAISINSALAKDFECVEGRGCAAATKALIKKAAKKRICKPERTAAIASARQKNFEGPAILALFDCVELLKDSADWAELDKAK